MQVVTAEIDGRLAVHLRRRGRRVAAVRLRSTRLLTAARLFRGMPVDEVLALLPRLFSVCATAQSCAAVRACEQALGRTAPAATEAVRDELLAVESLREHLWRIVLDWPRHLGETPGRREIGRMLELQRTHRHRLCGDDDPFATAARIDSRDSGQSWREMARLLADAVFGLAADRWLQIDRPAALAEWAGRGETVAARLLQRVTGQEWQGLGHCQVPVLEAPPERLAARMGDDAFIAAPTWRDGCRETGALGRNDSPLLRRLRAAHGNGLLPRLVARLTELAWLVCQRRPPPLASSRGRDWGAAPAARGLLLHRVRLEAGRIADYRILAPTEWNFHPRGVAVQALAAVSGEPERMRAQAALLLDAIDPCVGYDLVID